eukprot:TRINITY_DN8329_c0_g1_i1.p1 TRINITY_DN8329_c0_g1~~TRINITY_DN8329_c0_g1_i1.p1  ORF type:complete len:652 (+),score=135.76 TRINITY_DN8329_c0_g1_i1:102-2057(+)
MADAGMQCCPAATLRLSAPKSDFCDDEDAPGAQVLHLGVDRGYCFERSIGRGSFGEVLLVKDPRGRERVMKAIHLAGLDRKQRGDAPLEVEAMKRLRHPFVVRFRESFLEKGMLAIVMDFASAGTLLDQVETARKADRKSLPEDRVVRWMTQALLGLSHMDKLNMIHRDLKSENLFLEDESTLQIGDFGLARILDGKSASFVEPHIVGTPYYLSPEICDKGVYSHASDVWALGCVLYELLSLGVPFDASNLPSLMVKIVMNSAPKLPTTGPGSCSRELAEICSSMLAKSQCQRPSAGEALQRPLLQEVVVQLQQAAPPEHTRQPPLPAELPAPLPSVLRRLPPLNRQHSCGAIPHIAGLPKQQVHSAVPALRLLGSDLLQQAGSSAVPTTRDRASSTSSRTEVRRPRSVSPDAAQQQQQRQQRGLSTSGVRQRITSIGQHREEHVIATSRLPRLQLNPSASELGIPTYAAPQPAAAWPSARAVQRSQSATALPSARAGQQSSARRSSQKHMVPPPLLQLARVADGQSHGSKAPVAPRGCPLQSARLKSAAGLPSTRVDQSKDDRAFFIDKSKGLRNALGPGQVPVGGPARVLPPNCGVAAPPSSRKESVPTRSPSAPVVLESARAREKSLFSVRGERQLQHGGVAAPRGGA